MKDADSTAAQYAGLDSSIKRVLVLQCVVTLVVLFGVAGYSFLMSYADTVSIDPVGNGAVGNDVMWLARLKAASYGAALAMTSTILGARSMRRTSPTADDEVSATGKFSITPVFSGLLNKLVIVGGGIGFGLIVGLSPILVVSTYLVVQLSAATELLKAG